MVIFLSIPNKEPFAAVCSPIEKKLQHLASIFSSECSSLCLWQLSALLVENPESFQKATDDITVTPFQATNQRHNLLPISQVNNTMEKCGLAVSVHTFIYRQHLIRGQVAEAAGPESALGPLPSWTCLEHLHREATRGHPYPLIPPDVSALSALRYSSGADSFQF